MYWHDKYEPFRNFTMRLQKAFRLFHKEGIKEHEFLVLFACYDFTFIDLPKFTINDIYYFSNNQFSHSGTFKIFRKLTEMGLIKKVGKKPGTKGKPPFLYSTTPAGRRLCGRYFDCMTY